MTGRFEQKRKKCNLLWLAAVLLMAVAACGFFLNKNTPEALELRLQEKMLVRVTDTDQLHPLKELLSGAEDLGYEPKTFLLGPELVYIGKDGRVTVLELDMDSDLFRYEGRFYDYGPGNDNNAMPELLALLGLEEWPEEVKEAFPEWFASLEQGTVPTIGEYRQQAVYMDLWYPDLSYAEIQEEHALTILDALRRENPVQTDRAKAAVEDSVFTIHIAYDDGREYDLACIGEEEFLIWEGGKETVYGFSSRFFWEILEERIILSKAD